jgi:hypothetical protein
MSIFGFGSKVKPKPFGYKPRYYDPDKEEMEARLAKYRKQADSLNGMKERISTGLRRRAGKDAENIYQRESRKSNVRVLIILGLLIFATYLILKSDMILRMLEAFTNMQPEPIE